MKYCILVSRDAGHRKICLCRMAESKTENPFYVQG